MVMWFSTFAADYLSAAQLMCRRWMAWECDWLLSRSREWTNSPSNSRVKTPKS